MKPPLTRSARNSAPNRTGMSIERSNSMVIVDEVLHDRQRDIVTILVGAISCLSMASALAAMYTEASIAAYVAFTFPLFVAPYVIHQRAQINQLPSLRAAIAKCKDQVYQITAENAELRASVVGLSAKLKKLAFVDDRLSDVAKTINVDTSAFRKLIYTNANLQRQITKASQARDLQFLLSTFLAGGCDKDSCRTTEELDQLVIRLEAFGTRLPRDVMKAALERVLIKKRERAATPFHATVNTGPTQGCCEFYALSSS